MDYQEQKKQVTALLDKFVKEATEWNIIIKIIWLWK
jgi:hypothetical protein